MRIESLFVLAAYAQGIGHTIDVIEPGCNQCDLQNSRVIKPNGAQALVLCWPDACGIAGQLHNVIQHRAISLAERRRGVIGA